MLAISGSVDTASTGPALDDLRTVLRTLAADGLTEAERDTAVQNLVGVAPLKYERAASVADTLADQVQQHLPDDYQAQLYVRLSETSTAEATAAVIAGFPENRLVTILVGDASQISAPSGGPGNRRCQGRHRLTLRNPAAHRGPGRQRPWPAAPARRSGVRTRVPRVRRDDLVDGGKRRQGAAGRGGHQAFQQLPDLAVGVPHVLEGA